MVQEFNMEYKLKFELVPDGCWYSNLRTLLSKKQWDFLREDAKKRSSFKCAICGRQAKRLEAHEVWSYDICNAVQKLEDIISVCRDCHSVIHIGRTQLKGDALRAEKHFMKVNNCSYSEYIYLLGKANEEHRKRNEISEWKLDLSWLERYVND